MICPLLNPRSWSLTTARHRMLLTKLISTRASGLCVMISHQTSGACVACRTRIVVPYAVQQNISSGSFVFSPWDKRERLCIRLARMHMHKNWKLPRIVSWFVPLRLPLESLLLSCLTHRYFVIQGSITLTHWQVRAADSFLVPMIFSS